MSMVVCSRCDDWFDTDFRAEDIIIWEPDVVCVACATEEEIAEWEDEYPDTEDSVWS